MGTAIGGAVWGFALGIILAAVFWLSLRTEERPSEIRNFIFYKFLPTFAGCGFLLPILRILTKTKIPIENFLLWFIPFYSIPVAIEGVHEIRRYIYLDKTFKELSSKYYSKELSVTQEKVIISYFVDSMTEEQIAGKYNIPVKEVRQILRMATDHIIKK
jgi:hypothetical protein